jgi:hypothetical protein
MVALMVRGVVKSRMPRRADLLARIGVLADTRKLLIYSMAQTSELVRRLAPEHLAALSELEVEALEADIARIRHEESLIHGYAAMVEAWIAEGCPEA